MLHTCLSGLWGLTTWTAWPLRTRRACESPSHATYSIFSLGLSSAHTAVVPLFKFCKHNHISEIIHMDLKQHAIYSDWDLSLGTRFTHLAEKCCLLYEHKQFMKFKVLTEMKITVLFSWSTTPWKLVGRHRCFIKTYCHIYIVEVTLLRSGQFTGSQEWLTRENNHPPNTNTHPPTWPPNDIDHFLLIPHLWLAHSS